VANPEFYNRGGGTAERQSLNFYLRKVGFLNFFGAFWDDFYVEKGIRKGIQDQQC